MRAVLDTNILISACWTPDGLEAQTVRLAMEHRFKVCVSEAIWAEYEEVFQRPKFSAIRAQSITMLVALKQFALPITPARMNCVALDQDDQCFLECAEASGADYLVTGNLKHFPSQWASTRVVNARQFLSATGFSRA